MSESESASVLVRNKTGKICRVLRSHVTSGSGYSILSEDEIEALVGGLTGGSTDSRERRDLDYPAPDPGQTYSVDDLEGTDEDE